MKILIFIPARGGSKGIPGKNIINVNSNPLIYYTLETTKELLIYKEFSWIPFISSDNDKILQYCNSQNFEIDYRRPRKLAKDKSLVIDAIWDSISWLKRKNINPDAVLLLQPTTPLRNTSDIINSIKKVHNKDKFSIVSVTKMREHPNECVIKDENGWTYLSKPQDKPVGRQFYSKNNYFIDGSFYFASINFLFEHQSFLVENKTELYLLDQSWPIDIDEEDDLLVAETFLKKYGKN